MLRSNMRSLHISSPYATLRPLRAKSDENNPGPYGDAEHPATERSRDDKVIIYKSSILYNRLLKLLGKDYVIFTYSTACFTLGDHDPNSHFVVTIPQRVVYRL